MLRTRRGLSTSALAVRACVSRPYLSNIERGYKQLTPDIAKAIDRALSTTVLSTLVALRGDAVRRRAVLAQLGLAAGTAGATPAVAAEAIRLGLLGAARVDTVDWDGVVTDYTRQFVTDPSPAFGANLVTELRAVEAAVSVGTPSADALRGAAGLAQLYGLWRGNNGDLVGAHAWYDTAITLADSSRDTDLRAWSRGRTLARGCYEGYTARRTLDGADEVLALTHRPTAGALEAHVARVEVYAVTGDVKAGRRAVAELRDIAQRIDGAWGAVAAPQARSAFLAGFFACRVEPLAVAEATVAESLAEMEGWPLWQAELNAYLGRARVAGGDVAGGISHTLGVVASLEHDVRVIAVAVSDLLASVPAGYRSDELVALRGHASRAALPWETLR